MNPENLCKVNKITAALEKMLPPANVRTDEPAAIRTGLKCGGNLLLYITADDIEQLRFIIEILKAYDMPYFIIGNGTNILVTDSGFDGAAIRLGKEFSEISISENEIIAGASVSIVYLSLVAMENSLSGLEFACGIPGSAGGAVYMNAGAYCGEMKDIVKTVTAMTGDGEIYEYDSDELSFDYRHSIFMESGEIILYTRLSLEYAEKNAIKEKMSVLSEQRKQKQPLDYPSLGSFFKRPQGGFAAKMIDDAGLKGAEEGGAAVSEKHAGFIINKNHASASDVLKLADRITETVMEKYGIHLEPEVRIIGSR